ncbi:hypothetical protein PIB30_061888 [Stylosanthes scabra]|uniref:Uncharacterized protein n=1 Tax=Stylosanthes scabra TaxID=79078 RepID=A0ABU6UKE5_9FABA|nr:hypothetical protein [Stylosanthes scabra]
MKTPPNFEDEANVVEDNTTLFKEGVKFGEVRLEVGMRFKSKKDFMDAVRDKEHRDKGIIALLEEIRLFAMRSFAKNKLKLANHLGSCPQSSTVTCRKLRAKPIFMEFTGLEMIHLRGGKLQGLQWTWLLIWVKSWEGHKTRQASIEEEDQPTTCSPKHRPYARSKCRDSSKDV